MQQAPAESDWQDRILVFPEGSGIKPLYVVFQLRFKKVKFKAPSEIDYDVYQQEIDWDLKVNTRNGVKSNLDLALDGRSPFLIKDGKYAQVNLHHSKQNSNGPLFELSAKTHQKYYGSDALHPYLPKKHPLYPVDKESFDIDREAYWVERANNELKER